MRVLQINTTCGIGSIGRIASDIHKMLVEQGHESNVAYVGRKSIIINTINSLKLGILL